MQVVYHLGAPCTDEDMLIKSLSKNRAALLREGVSVPPVGRYRTIIRDTMRALKGRPASDETMAALIEAICDEDRFDRLVLSDPRFVCINRLVVQGAQIWTSIDRQTTNLRALFPKARPEFFIGMRDPATLIPALFRASRFTDFTEFAGAIQPRALRWSEMLIRLRDTHRDARIVVWANEDTPYLWGEILREMAGLLPHAPIEGADDLIETLMVPEGLERYRAYLAAHPPETEAHRRRVLTAFLEHYAVEDRLLEACDIPGWNQGLIDDLSANYDQDIADIAALDGIELLAP